MSSTSQALQMRAGRKTLVTHDSAVADAAERIVRMIDGRIISGGAADQQSGGLAVSVQAR